MSLERVSFKKGRKYEPRLSKPYVSGVRDERYWTEEENQILLDHYGDKGFAYCANKLPGRTKSGIYGQAKKLGLSKPGKGKRRNKEDLAALDAKIKELWPTLKLPPGAVNGVNELSRQLGEPRWLVGDRCLRLGLALKRKKEPNWTTAEDELMKRVPLHDPERCAEIFRGHGFIRTPTAIVVRSKRLDLKRRYNETFSATMAAALLGLDGKTVRLYCLQGVIKAGRRKSKRLIQQGGAPHSIERADLRQFVIDNLELIDFRKVDKFALVDLLVNGGGELAA